jgi:hypothetical protein
MNTIAKRLDELFLITSTISHDKGDLVKVDTAHNYPYITRTSENNGILTRTGLIDLQSLNSEKTFSLGLLQMDFFYQSEKWYAGQFVRKIVPLFEIDSRIALYFLAYFRLVKRILLKDLVRDVNETFNNLEITLPSKSDDTVDFSYMQDFIQRLQTKYSKSINSYLAQHFNGEKYEE